MVSRSFIVCLFCFASVQLSGQRISYERQKVSDIISIKVPTEFYTMEMQEARLKFVTAKAPLAVFSDANRSADISINYSSSVWEGDLSVLKEFYKANLFTLYDTVNIVRDEITEIGGKRFISLEFDSSVYGAEGGFRGNQSVSKHIWINYTLYDRRVLIFSVSVPKSEKSSWEDMALEVLSSVRIK